ncbi:hypothetical protein OQA88_838 [Cercophora sp. LCS_1]
MELASFYFGLFLAVFVFTFTKVVKQTGLIWRRTRSLANAYLWMIWIETWVNFIFALVTFLFLNDVIPGSLALYIGLVILWAIQTQLLSQIIANRVALIMVPRQKAVVLRWALFVAIGAVNLAVAFIWIRAQMPGATQEQIDLNHAFEKAEKSFFLVVDLGLNLLFLYLVRFRLIAEGLSKYWRLYHFNAGIVLVSTSMDILLLGFLNLPHPYLYVQFAPLAYIVKLHIELTMAVLISKVAKGGPRNDKDGLQSSSAHKTDPHRCTSRVVITAGRTTSAPAKEFLQMADVDVEARGSSSSSQMPLSPGYGGQGIVRTVETTVQVDEHAVSQDGKREAL